MKHRLSIALIFLALLLSGVAQGFFVRDPIQIPRRASGAFSPNDQCPVTNDRRAQRGDPVNHIDRDGLATMAVNGGIMPTTGPEDALSDFTYADFGGYLDAASRASLGDLIESTYDPVGYSARRSGTLAGSFRFPSLGSGWLEMGEYFSESVYRPVQACFASLDSIRYQALVAASEARRSPGDEIAAWQNSPGYKFGEIFFGAADVPMRIATALFSGATGADLTTGSTIVWKGIANGGGFGLAEVSPGERIFAAGLLLIPGPLDDALGRCGDDLLRIGRGARTGLSRNVTNFQGMEVRAVRDLSHVDNATLRAMSDRGFAAKTVNGDKIVLHHHQQNPLGPIIEVPAPNHSIGNAVQHPFGNTAEAGLTAAERAAFNTWRTDYWKSRAAQELSRRTGN